MEFTKQTRGRWRVKLIWLLSFALLLSTFGCGFISISKCNASRLRWDAVLPRPQSPDLPQNTDLMVYLDNSGSARNYSGAIYDATIGALRLSKLSRTLQVRFVGNDVTKDPLPEQALNHINYQDNRTNLVKAIQIMKGKGKESLFHILITDAEQSVGGTDARDVNSALHNMMEDGWGGHVIGIRGQTKPFYLFVFSLNRPELKKYVAELKEKIQAEIKQQYELKELSLTSEYVKPDVQLKIRALHYDNKKLKFSSAGESDIGFARGLALGGTICLLSEEPQSLTLSVQNLSWSAQAEELAKNLGKKPEDLSTLIDWGTPELKEIAEVKTSRAQTKASLSITPSPAPASALSVSPSASTQETQKYPVVEKREAKAGELNLSFRWSQPKGEAQPRVYKIVARLRLDNALPKWISDWSSPGQTKTTNQTKDLKLTLAAILGQPELKPITLYLRVGQQ